MYRGLYHPTLLEAAGFPPRKNYAMEKEALLPLLGTLGTLGRGALWLGGKALSGIGGLMGAKSVANAGKSMMAPRNAAVAATTASEARAANIANALAKRHGITPEQGAELYRRAQATSGGNVGGQLRGARSFGLGGTTSSPGQAMHNYLDATKPGPGFLERHSGSLGFGLMGAMAIPAFLPGGEGQMPEKMGAFNLGSALAKKPHLWQIPAATTVAGGALGAMGDDPVGGALGGLAAGLGGMGAHATAKQYRPQIGKAIMRGAKTPKQIAMAETATEHAPLAAAGLGGILAGAVGKSVGSRLGEKRGNASRLEVAARPFFPRKRS